MKKAQISIIRYVVLVLNVVCRDYVCGGDESSSFVVLVRDVSTDRVWETVGGWQGCNVRHAR